MKKLLVIALVVGIAAAIGYLLGTENGRAQRDQAIAKFNQKTGRLTDEAAEAVTDLTDQAGEVVTPA